MEKTKTTKGVKKSGDPHPTGRVKVGTIKLIKTVNSVKGGIGGIISGGGDSSKRYKKEIADLKENSALIHKLRPVSYFLKEDKNNTPNIGLIAEEVAQIIPQLVAYARMKDVIKGSVSKALVPDRVYYNFLSVLELAEIQKHEKRIQELKKVNAKLNAKIDSLEKANATDIVELKEMIKQMQNNNSKPAELRKAV